MSSAVPYGPRDKGIPPCCLGYVLRRHRFPDGYMNGASSPCCPARWGFEATLCSERAW